MAAFSFEVSGKIKAPTAEQLAALDAESSVLAYTSGTMPDGRHFYAYVAVTPSRYAEFHRKTAAREQMIIGEYGEVIEGGFEASAPADIRQRMREEYGFDEQYEKKLLHEISAEREVFFQKQQEDRIANGLAILLKKKQEGA